MMKKMPPSFHMPRNRHKQASMPWQGYVIKVDAGMEPLLLLFNKIPGVATVASCAGDDENFGYVAFAGDRRRTVKLWVQRLKESDRSNVLRGTEYSSHTGFGYIRFEHKHVDRVFSIVLRVLLAESLL